MTGLELKNKWREGQISVGGWSTSSDALIAINLARVGFDYVIIDNEHAPRNTESLREILWMFRDSETVPIVRVEDNRPDVIKQVLDHGAQGVLVPLVGTVDEAKRAIASCKYPPDGIRGFGPVAASNYGADDTYFENWNKNVIVMLQIELVSILNVIEEIAQLEGLDSVFIGPSDLSLSMGCFRQWDHPDFKSAVLRIVKAARENNIAPGIAVDSFGELKQAAEWIEKNAEGMQVLLTAEDGDLVKLGGKQVLRDHLNRFVK